jgi:hypothetical protein
MIGRILQALPTQTDTIALIYRIIDYSRLRDFYRPLGYIYIYIYIYICNKIIIGLFLCEDF